MENRKVLINEETRYLALDRLNDFELEISSQTEVGDDTVLPLTKTEVLELIDNLQKMAITLKDS